MCQNIEGPRLHASQRVTQALGFERDRSPDPSELLSSQKHIQWSSWWWWWEISAAGLSLLSTSLIIALLSAIDDMPLNRWMLPIQPNSILAALTTVSKTSLLVPLTACIGQLKWRHFILQPRPLDQLQQFDNASRGPWGSAILIYSFIFQVRSLVVLSLAVATLLALGIESSAQQIISFELREIKVANGSVLTTRAEAYYSRTWNQFLYLNGTFFERSYPGLADYNEDDRSRQRLKLTATTYSAFAGSPQKPYYTCPEPATRCQWDDFSTLGICGRTRNITVIRNCSSIGSSGYCDLWHPFDDRKFANGSENRYPINGDPISLEYSISNARVDYFTAFSSARLNTTASLGSIWTVKVNNDSSFDGYRLRHFESYTSDLYWCDRKLNNATASKMELEVDSVQSTPWAGLDGGPGLVFNQPFLLPWRESRNGMEVASSPSFPQSEYGNEYVFNTQGEPTYNISIPIIYRMREAVDSIMGAGLMQTKNYVNEMTPEGGLLSGSTLAYELSDYMLTHDIDTIIQNVADGLTAFMLEPNGDNAMVKTVSGYMIYDETRIHVRWVWLLLPALEALIACCLLALTIIVTNGQPLVKNSTIALLAYGLSNFDREELLEKTEVVTEERLEKRAERMMARLENDGPESYRFTKYL